MKRNYLLDNDEEHGLAIQIACERFEQLYPMEKQPLWLKYCMSMKVFKNSVENWVVRLKLRPKKDLKPNTYLAWQEDGIPIPVEDDPTTGQKMIVICDGPPLNDVVFFEVEIDIVNHLTSILVNCDLNTLDGRRFEMNRW